jgi:signal transduction histidine kinase
VSCISSSSTLSWPSRSWQPSRSCSADDEFKELGATLNDLLERLDTSFESQRRFVANASHELRTPLTFERTPLQVALADPDLTLGTLRRVCEKLLASGAGQERLIDALLTLASSERGLEEQETFDLAETARQALTQDALDRARRRGLEVRTSITSAATAGDPELAQRLVTNLVDNAIRHNHDNGQITLTTGTRAGRPFLSVANTGQIIADTEISRLLEPFQQLGSQRASHPGGHGLGLAIVAASSPASQPAAAAAAAAAGEAPPHRIVPPPAGGTSVICAGPEPDRGLLQPASGNGRKSATGN